MDLELMKVWELFPSYESEFFAKKSFYYSKYKSHDIILVCSGQGKTNASLYSQLLIDKLEIDAMINIGICGGISLSSQLLDVYVGEKYVHYDVRKKQSVNTFPNQLFYYANEELIDLILSLDYPMKQGVFGTGEGFVTQEELRESLIETFGIECVDMESASIAQVCFVNNTPFISIRTVTDIANEEAIETTENYQEKAMENVSLIVQSLIDNL